ARSASLTARSTAAASTGWSAAAGAPSRAQRTRPTNDRGGPRTKDSLPAGGGETTQEGCAPPSTAAARAPAPPRCAGTRGGGAAGPGVGVRWGGGGAFRG